jgi:hypothetical protein
VHLHVESFGNKINSGKEIIMTSYQIIIEQNNSAVAMLNHEEYAEAIHNFSHALRLLEKIGFFGKAVDSRTLSLNQCMLQSHQSETSWMDGRCDTNRAYIYQRGIVIPSTPNSVIITPIIIFNLALAHHLKAEQSKYAGQHKCFLQKALGLYELAYSAQGNGENSIFRFASVNNIALIHNDLNNTEMSEKCLEHMLSELMLLVDCGKGDHLQCVDGFLWNISYKTCPAAAA